MNYRKISIFSGISIALFFGLMTITGCDNLTSTNNDIQDNSNIVQSLDDVGSLQVMINGDFSGLRYTQAKIIDIATISIDVESLGGATQSHSISRTQLENAGSSLNVTFSKLAPGIATASVNIYNILNVGIGSSSATASIMPGQISTAKMAVQLIPTVLTSGSLTADITILDGPTLMPSQDNVLPPTIIFGKLDQQQLRFDTFNGGPSSEFSRGQSFTPSQSGLLTAIQIRMGKMDSNPTTEATMSIFTSDISGTPTGEDIGHAQVTDSSIPIDVYSGWTTAYFSPPISLEKSKKYSWVLTSATGALLYGEWGDGYLGGNAISTLQSSTSWTTINADYAFQTYMKE